MTKTLTLKNIFFVFNLSILFLFLLFPIFTFSQGVTSGLTYECVSGGVYGNCTFNDLVLAVRNIVNRVIPIVLGFTVVVIAYVGFNYMISGDNPGKRSEANKMLQKVAIGIFFMMAAWMIVNLIATALIDPNVPIPRILN